jgi:hypothetical protein
VVEASVPSHLTALGAACLFLIGTCSLFPGEPLASAEVQPRAVQKLETVKALTCVFPLLANGTWRGGEPRAVVKVAKLSMRFDAINTEEGTARVSDGFGHFEITARLSADTLHFVQSFAAGPLYVTTVFNAGSRDGKLKAVHTRHEFTDAVLPGYTSSPEQYYGECEVDR